MLQDLTQIVTTVLPTDPSFRSIRRDVVVRHIEDARQAARATSRDDFLLSLMRLLALPGNGHTRLIPNDAISIVPLKAHHSDMVAPPFRSSSSSALMNAHLASSFNFIPSSVGPS